MIRRSAADHNLCSVNHDLHPADEASTMAASQSPSDSENNARHTRNFNYLVQFVRAHPKPVIAARGVIAFIAASEAMAYTNRIDDFSKIYVCCLFSPLRLAVFTANPCSDSVGPERPGLLLSAVPSGCNNRGGSEEGQDCSGYVEQVSANAGRTRRQGL